MITVMPTRLIITRNKIISLLVLLLVSIPIFVNSQNKIAFRKQKFLSTIETLKLNPEKLYLENKDKSYNQDSLQKYYNLLIKEYRDKQKTFNKSQNICWLYEIGHIKICLKNYNEAIETFKDISILIDKQEHPKSFVRLGIELADAYRLVGKKRKSNEIMLELLDMPIIQHETQDRINCLRLLSENYEYLKEYQKAMELSLQLYNSFHKEHNYAHASYELVQMGRMAAFLESDTTYLEYFHLANRMAKKSGHQRRIGNNLVNTGYAYSNAGYPQIALRYLHKALEYANYYPAYGYVYNLLGLSSAYFLLDSIPKAFSYAKKSMKISIEIEAYNYVYQSSLRFANCLPPFDIVGTRWSDSPSRGGLWGKNRPDFT